MRYRNVYGAADKWEYNNIIKIQVELLLIVSSVMVKSG